MQGLYYLLPALVTIFVSFLIVRAAAIALAMTGLDQNKARFQALSAFSGTGFTTKEAELVVNHPVRRKIVTWLIISGNAGIVTLIVTTTSSMVGSEGYGIPLNIVILLAGGLLIYNVIARSSFMQRWERFVRSKLIKSRAFEEDTTEDLLHLIEGYGLVRAMVLEGHPHAGKILRDCGFKETEIIILGIERSGKWIPSTKGELVLAVGDSLIAYGPLKELRAAF